MAAGGPDPRALSAEEIEQLTDLMVSKLATLHIQAREGFLDEDPGRPYRDEIRQTIVDTVFLMQSDDPHATLERWMDAA